MLSFFSNGGSFPSSFAGGVSFQAHGAHPLSKLCWRIVKADELNEIIMGWCGVTFWVGLLFYFFYLSEGSICYSSATYQQNHLNQRIFFYFWENFNTRQPSISTKPYPSTRHNGFWLVGSWRNVAYESASKNRRNKKVQGSCEVPTTGIFWITPQKSNIDTPKMAIFESRSPPFPIRPIILGPSSR